MMRRLHEIHCIALHACVLLGVLLPGAATAAAPRLEVQARIHQDAGEAVQRSVAPGAVLRSGDDVRLRVTAWTDGYLYVVALGSSGAAVVLHPFAGPAEPVRAGEELAVPRDGGFLPLDSRPGREHVLAFVSDKPLESLARLLVRLEAAGAAANAASLRELMTAEGFEAAHLAFGHGRAAVTVASAPAGSLAAGSAAAASPQPATPAPPPAAGDVGPSEVLSGLGSRIARFTSRTPGAATAPASAPAPQAAAMDPVAIRAPRAADNPSGGILASLFRGAGDAPAPDPQPPSQPPPPAASTFPLGMSGDAQAGTEFAARDAAPGTPRGDPRGIADERSMPASAPSRAEAPAPLPVPASTAAARDAQADPPMPAPSSADVVVPLPSPAGLHRPDVAAGHAEPPVPAGIPPQPGGAASGPPSRSFGPASETRDAQSVTDSARMEPEPELADSRTPDVRIETPASPRLPEVPPPPVMPTPTTAAEAPADAPANVAPLPRAAGATASGSVQEGAGGGLLAGLARLFGARASEDSETVPAAAARIDMSSQASPPEPAAHAAATVPAGDAARSAAAASGSGPNAGSVPPPAPERAPPAVAETMSTAAATAPVRAGAVRADAATAAAVTDAEAQAAAADAPSAAPDTTGRDSGKSGGWLAGLGAFFGGSREPAPTADAAPAAREDNAPRLNIGPEPTLSRRVDESGRSVVILDSAAPPPQRDSEVLSGSGSRIRALLDEPEPPRTAAVPAPAQGPQDRAGHVAPGVPAQAAAAPIPSPAPATPAVANAQPMVTSARDAAPPEAAQSVPAIPVVSPDPVLDALASGAAVAGAEPATPVALLTAAPAHAVAHSAARLAQVDLSSNAGAAAAVVMVVTPEGATSGVLVNARGHVLTNWHSVRAYDAVLVLFKQADGTGPAVAMRSLARLVAHSKFADLALLQVDSLPSGIAPPVLVSRVEVDGGAPLHAIGPGDDGQWRHSVATVDRIRRNSSWYSTRRVLHRADVVRAEMADPQDVAGVPLFNNALELVGLGAMSRSDKGELIGISAGTLRTFLAATGE